MIEKMSDLELVAAAVTTGPTGIWRVIAATMGPHVFELELLGKILFTYRAAACFLHVMHLKNRFVKFPKN